MSLNLIVTQMPFVSEISSAMQSHPEVQQSIAQAQAVEARQFDREQIQKPEKDTPPKAVDPEAKKDRGNAHAMAQRRKPPRPKKDSDEPSDCPWAGHIINVKI